METSPPTKPKGPKACSTCAKAKARCIPRSNDGKCERCHRLGKHCFSRAPAPPRLKKRPKRSRVAELEKRLDELSSETLHHRYGDAFAHLFPFVVISTPSAAETQTESPLVFKAIMLVACFFEGTRQLAMADELLSDLVSAAMVEGRKTLDLLQSLELLIAWFHFGLKSSQLINLLFLTRSIAVNLEASSYDEAGFRRLHHVRAFAGVFYLNNVIFTTNKRTDILMSTAHLDEYCNALTSANEYPSDDYLVRLVRLQQLAQGIAIAVTPASSSEPSSLPFAMVIESFRDQLDTFRVTLPPHIASIPTMQCNITVVEILLSDVTISEQHCTGAGLTPSDRLHLLWSCVHSLRAFFQIRFSMFDLDRPRFLSIIVSDLAYAFITGIKLLALRLPGLDPDRIGQELALDQMLSQQVHDLAQIIQRRSSVDDHPSGLEDPLEKLQRLLMTGQELVALQLSGVPMREIADTLVQEMSKTQWHDLS
ncbi:hypothetical protein CP533_6889 [Ophiocordyceps camponoti-saundersi (nom. inval.)]|nr:hypothetical protein CP533_6889 [Ophiocordyceps camponoti-saundersi (nom. inval.)]